MLRKDGKYLFHQKDDFSSLLFRVALIKRNKNYVMTFNKKIDLRCRSVENKKNRNKNNNFHHALVCQDTCSKNCNLETHKKRKLASSIIGLNCDQVNENLYASSRLTNRIIIEYNLINKFKELNIGLIVNCEEEGEHPCCGTPFNDGLDPSGYAYSTTDLEKNDIHVLKCGWVDFLAPYSFNHIIKVIKKMYYYIHSLNKKVLVHCHAGFGRTAISLCCYLIFEKKLSPEAARQEIRKGARKMCLQGQQFIYCQEFAQYLELSRQNFFKKDKKDIDIFKINEKVLDIGNYKFLYFNDKNFIENIPIFLIYILDRIIQIKTEKNIDEKTLNNYLIDKEKNKEEELKIEALKKEINNYNWDAINKCQDIKTLGKLLFIWLNNSIKYVINPNEVLSIDDKSYPLYIENLKTTMKNTLIFITKFILLIIGNKSENIDEFKDFLTIFISSLFFSLSIR